MIDQNKRTYQSQTLSLLTLKLILTEAKKESPPQMRKEEQCDEELALNLIVSMKKGFVIARSVGCDEAIPNTSRRLLRWEEHPPRNDIQIEP
jgi:hypothetical protein